MSKLVLLIVVLSLRGVLPVTAQIRNHDVPLSNWHAPTIVRASLVQAKDGHLSASVGANATSNSQLTQPLVFIGIVPCRLADTRDSTLPSPFGPPAMVANEVRTITVTTSSRCNIPSIAQAYSLNFTVVPPGSLGYLTAWPTSNRRIPDISILNSSTGLVIANAAVILAGTAGSIDVFVTDPTDVLIDVNGYYVPQGTVSNPSGDDTNTVLGASALRYYNGGFDNTAIGASALFSNDVGVNNSAIGAGAMFSNTSGRFNTAVGLDTLYGNTDGNRNTAVGTFALNLGNGSYNIGLGDSAGHDLTTGSYNIMVGNKGVGSDDHVIRIGDVQTQTFVVGISGVNVSGVPVLVSNTGQLGIASSSRRFKRDIQDMGDSTANLMRLRPVTYRYKQPFEDGSQPLQYGLIAEDVAEVYPELVAHSADGKIETVKYQLLDSMLLNELQKQNATITAQKEKIQSLEERLSRLESLLEAAASEAAQK